MMPDLQCLLSSAQALSGGASDTGYASSNWFKLPKSGADIAVGSPLWLILLITTTLDDSGDDSALNCYLATDDNSSGSSPTNLALMKTFAATQAAGVAGALFNYRIPPGLAWETHLGVFYQSTNGALSAGAISAYLSPNAANFVAYTGGFVIA